MASKKSRNNGENTLVETEEIPLIIESMDAQKLEWNIGYFVELMDKKQVNFDTPIQRGYVWNKKKDSLLIRSILRHIPISNFYYNRTNGIYEGLEGKQRGRAIYEFVKGGYCLHANTPPIKVNEEEYPIAKHFFADLPETLQNRILRYGLDGHCFENMSIGEKVEFFILTNSGKPVTSAEISRISIKSRGIFIELSEHPAIISGMSVKNRIKCKDEDILSQVWCLCFSDEKSLLQKDIGPILKMTEVTPDEKEKMTQALDYLLGIFSSDEIDKKVISKMKKPTHILSLIYMGFLANQKGMSKEDYVKKATALFTTEGRTATVKEEYNRSVLSGSSKPEQIRIRIDALEDALT